MEPTNCPGCGASTVLLGYVLSLDGRAGSYFVPCGVGTSSWTVNGVDISAHFACRSSCGFLWSRVKPDELRDLIAHRGTEIIRQHFATLEAGRYHGLPDVAEAREAADGVVEIDALVLSGQLPEATRRFRERTRCIWDRAIDTLRHWHDLSRAEKLAMLGWCQKETVAAPNRARPITRCKIASWTSADGGRR